MKKLFLILGLLSSLLVASCGGGGGGNGQSTSTSTTLFAEGTLTRSTDLVTGGQTYTISWTSKNADSPSSVTLEVREFDATTLIRDSNNNSLPLPSPTVIGSGLSGSITETAVSGRTRMYELRTCRRDTGCDRDIVFVWEKQSLLSAFAVKGGSQPLRWKSGITLAVCDRSTSQYMKDAVQSAVNDINNLLGSIFSVVISPDPNACGSTITTNYIVVEEAPLPSGVYGNTAYTDDGTHFLTATVKIDTAKISTREQTFNTTYHEFAHALGFWNHVNDNLESYLGYGSFLMGHTSPAQTKFDELTTVFLQVLYGLR